MKDESCERGKNITGNNLPVSPDLPGGTVDPYLDTFSSGKLADISCVQIGPAATPFTRMPLYASGSERVLVKTTMAP
jgi:hypothetical protein